MIDRFKRVLIFTDRGPYLAGQISELLRITHFVLARPGQPDFKVQAQLARPLAEDQYPIG